MSSNNQPQVYITNVNMTMDQAGFDQADFDKWTSMSYLVDQESGVTAGLGTTAFDNSWNVTVSIRRH